MIRNTLLYCGLAGRPRRACSASTIAYLVLRTQPAGTRLARLDRDRRRSRCPGVVLAIGYLRFYRGVTLPGGERR